jgi:tetratricopeptide (TPR) repeat protein
MPASSGEAASLIESAMLLRWRAPELALLLADRAVTAAQDDQMAILRAEHLAIFALNRLGRHGEAAYRLLPAIRDAATPASLRNELHVELALCAIALGEPATALEAVRVVLAAGDDVAPVLRGTALVAAAEASDALGRGDILTPALEEADELYREDPTLDRDTALLLRAAAKAADAARHRRCGAAAEAEAQAKAGRELLAGLADPEHDSGEVNARLMLEIVLVLLDRDEGDAAMRQVRPLLRRPVRAAAAGAVARLRLALATRVHLAEGRYEPALTLLADAVEGAQRHGVDAVLAECLEGLSHVHEARGEFADALHCVRAAHAAESRHRRNVEAARAMLLEHWGFARPAIAGLVDQVIALLGATGPGSAGSDPDAGLLNAEITAVVSPRRTSENDDPPAGDTVGAEPPEVKAPVTEASEEQAPEAKAPDMEAPEAETSTGGITETDISGNPTLEIDLGVKEKSEAEAPQTAGEISEAPAPASVALPQPALGVSQVNAAALAREPASPVAFQPVTMDAGLASQEAADLLSTESSAGLTPWHSGARHRRGSGTLVCVSDLLPASALSAGRSGRRRAEERSEGAPPTERRRSGDGEPKEDAAGSQQAAVRTGTPSSVPAFTYPLLVQPPAASLGALEREVTDSVPPEDPEESPTARREFPASGPPPAPTPRAMEWESESAGSAGDESRQMGLGDLLAEALAAYQESRDVRAHHAGPIRPSGENVFTVADAGISRAGLPYRSPGTRWMPGLQLASPIDRRDDDPSEALTNPLLRLPDLTAEPLWIPPETGRRSAAGD